MLNFDRASVGVNKLQTDPRALRELKAAWGSSLLFSKRHLVTPHPVLISFINSGSLSSSGAKTALVVTLVQLWSDATGPPAAEMPLCGNTSWVQAQGPGGQSWHVPVCPGKQGGVMEGAQRREASRSATNPPPTLSPFTDF